MAIVIPTSPISGPSVYAGIVADIYAITARPDLVTETALAVRKATMKAHLADFWKYDLKSVLPTIPILPTNNTVSFRYTLDLTDSIQFPLIRKVCAIKEYNTTPTGYEIQFAELDADRLLDGYQLEEINYWTQLAQQVSIRCNKSLAGLQVMYWKYPNVDITVYDSWIAQKFPDLIVEEAAAQIFKVIGKDTEYARLRDNFAENIHMLTMSLVG